MPPLVANSVCTVLRLVAQTNFNDLTRGRLETDIVKIAIMQPYFLPYIGYFQLIGAVDVFVVYDNIKYTKKGWINRNRIADHVSESIFSLPLKAGSDSLDVCERELAQTFVGNKFLQKFSGTYSAAPQYAAVYDLLKCIMQTDSRNLFEFIHASLRLVCAYTGLTTPMVVSSSLPIDHTLKGKDKVLALCKELGATQYINPIGGVDLYDKAEFAAQGVELGFLQAQEFVYPRLGGVFIPWLSIIDVLMFNAQDVVSNELRHGYRIT